MRAPGPVSVNRRDEWSASRGSGQCREGFETSPHSFDRTTFGTPGLRTRNAAERKERAALSKALIVFATRTSETRRIGGLIAEGMRFEGVDVTMVSVSEYERQKIDPRGYDAVVLGSPTYHGQMMESMKTLLFALEKTGLEGKAGGAFGAYGWSGEAAERIYGTMYNVFGMKLVNGPLMLKSTSVGGAMKAAQDYGREIARLIPSAEAGPSAGT